VPLAGLIKLGGTLYGTTGEGGTYSCAYSKGFGTVFSVTPSGVEAVLHSFGGAGDGTFPWAALINVGGTLYGTTRDGGANNNGTVFSVTPQGVEKVLYSFAGGSDGANPEASLIRVGDAFYGTTGYGGSSGNGTVFKVTRKGVETVLHSFGAQAGDGANPWSGLLDVDGVFYGTTENGGANGFGTVFMLTPQGTETVLYSFAGGANDGENPIAGLIDVGGVLYGTTGGGGKAGWGTVFAVTP